MGARDDTLSTFAADLLTAAGAERRATDCRDGPSTRHYCKSFATSAQAPSVTDTAAARQAESRKSASRPLNAARGLLAAASCTTWHWISAALSLVGLMLFAVTGITLNHAAPDPGRAGHRPNRPPHLPAPLLARLADFPAETTDPAPDAVARWAAEALKVKIAGKPTETTAEELYVALPEPGGDGWLTIDRATGEATARAHDARLGRLPQRPAQGPQHRPGLVLVHRRLRRRPASSSRSPASP